MDDTIVIKMDDGTEVECTVIETFYWEENGKSYVLYTDNTVNEKGETNIFASSYDEAHPDILNNIETAFEWHVINQVLEEIQEEMKV